MKPWPVSVPTPGGPTPTLRRGPLSVHRTSTAGPGVCALALFLVLVASPLLTSFGAPAPTTSPAGTTLLAGPSYVAPSNLRTGAGDLAPTATLGVYPGSAGNAAPPRVVASSPGSDPSLASAASAHSIESSSGAAGQPPRAASPSSVASSSSSPPPVQEVPGAAAPSMGPDGELPAGAPSTAYDVGGLLTTLTLAPDPPPRYAYSTVDTANGDVYATLGTTSTIYILSGTTNQVIGSIALPPPPPLFLNIPQGIAYDSDNGNLYVALSGIEEVAVISTASDTAVAEVEVGDLPSGVAVDPVNDEVYVTNPGSDSVSVISGVNDSRISTSVDTIPVEASPLGIAFDPDRGAIYVANTNSNSVSVISAATNTIITTVNGVGTPDGIAVDTATDSLYVADGGADQVTVITTSGATFTVLGEVPLEGVTFGVAYDSANGDVYATLESDGDLDVISTQSNWILASYTPASGVGAYSATYDPLNGEVYVDCGSGVLQVFSTLLEVGSLAPVLRGTPQEGLRFSTTTYVGGTPNAAVADPDDGDVYVTNTSGSSVNIVDASSGQWVGNFTTGVAAQTAAYDGQTGDLYVLNRLPNTLSVVSTATNETVATFSVQAPEAIVYDPANGDLYVGGGGADQVTVISGNATSILTTLDLGLPAGGQVSSLVYDPDDGTVYATSLQASAVYEISGTTNTVVGSLSLPSGAVPYQVAYDDEDHQLYVSDNGNGEVDVFDPATLSVVAEIPTAEPPTFLAFDGGNDDVYVTMGLGTDLIGIISGSTHTLLRYLTAPAYPRGMTYDPQTGDLYVAVTGSMSQASYLGTLATLGDVVASPAPTLDVGQDIVLAAPVLGQGAGSDTPSISVLPSSGLSCWADPQGYSVEDVDCLASAPGSYQVTLGLQDHLGAAVSTSTVVTVSSDPVIAHVIESTPSADVGQSVTFDAVVSSGDAPYTYLWNGLPTGCASVDAADVSCSPGTLGLGATYVSATVEDANGFAVVSQVLQFGVYADPQLAPLSMTPGSVDVGQPLSLATVLTGGSGGEVYSWAGLPTGCLSTNAPTLSCTPSQAGTYPVSAYVEDSDGFNSTSGALVLVVAPLPTIASLGASASSLDVGQSVVLSATGTSGAGGLLYSWTGLPPGCASASSWTLTCAPTATGTFASITLTVTDSNGGSATAASPLSLTVYSAPVLSPPSLSSGSVDVGQSLTVSTTSTGGSGGPVYSWTGLPTGCLSANAPSISCLPTTPGIFTVLASEEDSDGMNVSAGPVPIAVYASPTVTTLTASVASLDVGQSVVISASGTSGSGGLQFLWSGLPVGCSAAASWSLSCQPTAQGTFPSVGLTVVDSDGGSATAPTLSLTVYADPAVQPVSASRTTADAGQTVDLTASSSPGSGGDVVSWSGLPTGCLSSPALAISCSPTVAGTYTVVAHVEDSNGWNASSTGLTLVVSALPTVTGLSESAAAVDVGRDVTFSSAGSTGSGGLLYAWTGLPTGCAAASSWTLTCAPTAPGTFSSITLTVTDSNGGSATAAAALSLTVSADPTAPSPLASPSALDVGQTLRLTASPAPGSGGETLSWWGLPTGCESANATTLTCSPSVAGSYEVSYSVVDSHQVNVTSPSLLLQVSPSLGVPALGASATSLEAGATLTLSATVSGGLSPYTFQWAGLPAGCAAADQATVVCAPGTAGTFQPTVEVSDANGDTSTSAPVSITVVAALHVVLSVSPSSGVSPTTLTFTASTQGGAPSPSYQWFLNGSLVAGASGSTLTLTGERTGSYAVWVVVTDSDGDSATSSPVTVQVSAPAAPTPASAPFASAGLDYTVLGMLGLLLLIAVVLLALNLLRRRGTSKEGPAPSERPPPGTVVSDDAPAGKPDAPQAGEKPSEEPDQKTSVPDYQED